MIFPFEVILIFSYLSVFLLVGIILRAYLKIFQSYFIPASILGGLLGLIFYGIMDYLFSLKETFSLFYIEAFAYHFFNLSFISIGLTPSENQNDFEEKSSLYKGSLWMAFTQGVTFPLQAVIGGLVVYVLIFFGINIHPTLGFLFPLGFNEGPGQALSMGRVWETYGFQDATTIGLAFATIGYLFSIFVGVPLSNWFIRKGYIENTKEISMDYLKGYFPPNIFQIERHQNTFHQSNIEPLAFQFSLIGLVYLLTYIFVSVVNLFLPEDLQKVMWGFFFIFGLLFAFLIRNFLKIIKKEYLIQIPLQRRITSFSVDYLIVSTIVAIKIVVFLEFFIPILLISIVGGIFTLFVIVFLGRKFRRYGYERILAIFGTVTGTTSTGLLLLRIVDPAFKTPVSKELAIMNLFSIPIVGAFTFFLNSYYLWKFSLLEMIVVYAISGSIFFLILIFIKKLYK